MSKIFQTNTYVYVTAIVGVALLAAAIFLYLRKKKEMYGGPVKVITKIPFDRCKNICTQYYKRCMVDFANADPGFCQERFLGACVNECYYSNYHRI